MPDSVASLLGRGIDHLMSGGSMASFLEQAGPRSLADAHRDELKALLEQAAELLEVGRLAIAPPKAKAANRARFLGAVAAQREELRLQPGPGRFASLVRLRRGLVGAVLSLAIVLMIGGGVVSASVASLPGSALYPVKLAAENVRLALASDHPTRARLYIRFANERGSEIVRLAEIGQSADQDVLARMAHQWEGALQSAERGADAAGSHLLEDVWTKSQDQATALREAIPAATPETQPALSAGAAIAEEASRQAEEAMQQIQPPPTPPTAEPTPSDTQGPPATQPPVVAPEQSRTPSFTPSDTATVTSSTTPTCTPTLPERTLQAPSLSPTPSSTPDTGPSGTPLPKPTTTSVGTPVSTSTLRPPSPTPSPTFSPTPRPSDTVAPTETPVPSFRLTNEDTPDPVPATHRIHYVICIVNEGQGPLTNVEITDRWSPRECVYYLPGNPELLTWTLGTVGAGTRSCVAFALNTYSICGGRTVNNQASMMCDQGWAGASSQTRIGPTPVPSLTATLTPTVTSTLTMAPTDTPVSPTAPPTATLTAIETGTSILPPTATPTLTATATVSETMSAGPAQH